MRTRIPNDQTFDLLCYIVFEVNYHNQIGLIVRNASPLDYAD